MSFLKGKELQGVLIAISAWLLISGAINVILGSYFLKWPLLLIPLSLGLFLTVRRITMRLPFINREDSFIGQTVHIVLVVFFYSVFAKSLSYYLNPILAANKWTFLVGGFALMLYAVKFHLVDRNGGMP